MVQEFHVVRCFSCQSFQVQQVKKAKKWICKLCGHKQSLIKEFGRGSGIDCRRHVQKLNAMRGALMEEAERDALLLREKEEEEDEEEVKKPQEGLAHFSRWDKYMNTPKEEDEEEEGLKENVTDMQQLHKLTNRKRRRSETEREENTPEQSHSLSEPEPAPKTRAAPLGDTSARLPTTDCPAQETMRPSSSELTKPHLLPPVPSMFESGEDFDFDDLDYLTDQRV